MIWKWNWGSSSADDASDCPSDIDNETIVVPETVQEEHVQEAEPSEPITHTLVFKCIGVTRDHQLQETLSLVSREMNLGQCVNVELVPEPNNPVDSQAIAFMCTLGDTVQRKKLGYVVREGLDAVHSALANKEIVSAKVAWSRYLIHWSRSGPGWYAGIAVTKTGEWPARAVLCRSTL